MSIVSTKWISKAAIAAIIKTDVATTVGLLSRQSDPSTSLYFKPYPLNIINYILSCKLNRHLFYYLRFNKVVYVNMSAE